MTEFAVTFKDGKLGRGHVAPQEFVAWSAGALATVMEKWVRKHLLSREVEVVVYGDGTGAVVVGGFRTVGEFEWREVPS